MKSSFALTIFIIDLLGGIVILILTICIMGTQSSTRRLSQIEKIPNLRGSKLNLSEIHFNIKSQEKKNQLELSNLDEDEFVLSHKQISSQSLPKRKLEDPSEDEIFRMMFVLLLNLLALHFTFVIGFSFLVDQNECCDNFNDSFCYGFFFFIFNFAIAYCSTKACGKHTSRYVGITSVMLISITNCFLTSVFQSPYYNHSLMVSTIVITGLMSVINLLGILLPNLICCSSLREEAEPMQQPILSSQAQLPSYIPPSSDFANVPTYPPNNPAYPSGYPSSGYDSSQGNLYANPQPQPIPLQSV